MFWRVLYTNPRAEMKVTQRLEKIGVEAYCPARMEMRQRSDRKKKIWVPLLPSMVLVNIEEREKNKVFDVQGVVRYLFWLGQPAKVSVEEVLTLKEVTEAKNLVAHEVIKKGVGAEVELLGTQRGVIAKTSASHFWVELKGLNYLIKLTAA
ncbi:UpxY family transcription antiterminator [Cyclobacteriaceae bacterium]|nr:UpxY family transcription antiterminator [Cyclobacteriaceae bacterium]